MTRTQLLGLIAVIAIPHAAQAHGIAGNRYVPGTLTFDDPVVADELMVSFSTFNIWRKMAVLSSTTRCRSLSCVS
jgi:hypothetical protein